MAPADFGRTIDAYQNWLCDVAAPWHYGGGGGGGGGYYGISSGGGDVYDEVNSLINSENGGFWSSTSGTYYYRNQDEAFKLSCFFIEANNLWSTTVGGNFSSAIMAYDGGRLANEIIANNPKFLTTSLDGDPQTISIQDLAPKQNFSGFWGGLRYILNGGIVDGYKYNREGNAIGWAPITGMAPTPGFAKGMKVLQTGGHILTPTTLKALNLTKEEGKFAIESMKKANGLSNNFHGKILKNGDVLDNFGNFIDNLLDYLH